MVNEIKILYIMITKHDIKPILESMLEDVEEDIALTFSLTCFDDFEEGETYIEETFKKNIIEVTTDRILELIEKEVIDI